MNEWWILPHHLCLQATEVKVNEVDFNPQFVSRMIPKLQWSALVQAAAEVNLSHDDVICDCLSLSGTVTNFNQHEIAVTNKCHLFHSHCILDI